jgi:hypothetical protein
MLQAFELEKNPGIEPERVLFQGNARCAPYVPCSAPAGVLDFYA